MPCYDISHHISCHIVSQLDRIVGQNRQVMSWHHLFQADAGERGLPALTTHSEEGFNTFLCTQYRGTVFFLLSFWMISYQYLQETPMGAVAWNKEMKKVNSDISLSPSLSAPSPSIPWLQRKFLIDEISAEWFECIGANYSGNGETLLRNAGTLPKCRHTLQRNPKKINLGFCADSC